MLTMRAGMYLQAVWLLRLCGITLPSPKEFDDPNTTLQVQYLCTCSQLGLAARMQFAWGS